MEREREIEEMLRDRERAQVCFYVLHARPGCSPPWLQNFSPQQVATEACAEEDDGVPEIIWQGNEIIVRKKRAPVPKVRPRLFRGSRIFGERNV